MAKSNVEEMMEILDGVINVLMQHDHLSVVPTGLAPTTPSLSKLTELTNLKVKLTKLKMQVKLAIE